MRKILTGIVLGIITRHAYVLFEQYLRRKQLVYDIAMLERTGDAIKLSVLLCNYSGSGSIITIKEFQVYDGERLVASKPLNYGTIRLMDNERIAFNNIHIPVDTAMVKGPVTYNIVAVVDGSKINLKPFQSINNRAVYDENRASLYQKLAS